MVDTRTAVKPHAVLDQADSGCSADSLVIPGSGSSRSLKVSSEVPVAALDGGLNGSGLNGKALPALNDVAASPDADLLRFLSQFKGCLAWEPSPFRGEPKTIYTVNGIGCSCRGDLVLSLTVVSAGRQFASLAAPLDSATREVFPAMVVRELREREYRPDDQVDTLRLAGVASLLYLTKAVPRSLVEAPLSGNPEAGLTRVELFGCVAGLAPEVYRQLRNESPVDGRPTARAVERFLATRRVEGALMTPQTFLKLLIDAQRAGTVTKHVDSQGVVRYSLM